MLMDSLIVVPGLRWNGSMTPLTQQLRTGLLAIGFGAAGLLGDARGQSPAASGPQAAPRLVDSIEAPLLYLALGGKTRGGGALGGGAAGAASTGRAAVQRLLADPALDALLDESLRDEPAATRSSSTGRSLALVRGVLSRCAGEIEVAMTGVVPGIGRPLLVLRAELQPEQAKNLDAALRPQPQVSGGGSRLAANHRKIRGQQTYAMLGEDGRLATGIGRQVELAVVGSDLLVTNDATAMEELLAPQRTTASPRALSGNDRFVALKQRIAAPAGSLLVYGDWPTENRAAADRSTAAGTRFTATVLLDFEQDNPNVRALRAPGRKAPPFWDSPGIDGWLTAALSVKPRQLARDLPGGGLGGLVLAMDLPVVATRSPRGARLLRDLRNSLEAFGLDFKRNVLSRLGTRGTVQLLFRRGADGEAATRIESIYAVRATSRTAASNLFTDLRRAAEQHGIGKVLAGRDRPGRDNVDVLELRVHPEDEPTCVAVASDAVLVAFDATSIDEFLTEHRAVARQRGKRNSQVGAVVERIGGREVSGLFDLDFTPWLERFADLLGERGVAVDLSGIPSRHVGYLDLQPRDGGTIIRICVLSSR
ncbi:unnamed protein product [Symbiodinium sp. KB8]|nr:unnamed protein product [Symbiodinium sp. KB8]